MDTTNITSLQGLVLLTAFLLLSLAVWWLLRPRLPAGAAWLGTRPAALALARDQLGGLMLIAIGTYGTNQLLRLLVFLAACGLQAMVGSILIVENNAVLLNQFLERVPPVFRDRLVVCVCPRYNGFANASVADVLRNVNHWGPPVEDAANELVDRHLRRNRSRAPSVIFAFWSLGGQAALGVPLVPVLERRFPVTLKVAATALPIFVSLRAHFAELKAIYERAGIFGWLPSDNLAENPRLLDSAMVALIEALLNAALAAEHAPAPNNTLRQWLGSRGAVGLYQVTTSSVVAYPTGHLFWRRYYVLRQPLVDEVLDALDRLGHNEGLSSLPGIPAGEDGTATFNIVSTSLYYPDLRELEATVGRGRGLREQTLRAHGDALGNGQATAQAKDTAARPSVSRVNYQTIFASMVADVPNPTKALCPVLGLRLQCARDGAAILDEIVKSPAQRVLAAPAQPLPPTNPTEAAAAPAAPPAPDDSPTEAEGDGDVN